MKNHMIKKGDIIGVIAPSRPIWNIKEEVDLGLQRLEKEGFLIKKGKNLEKHFYYSAGTIQERCEDLHEMFLDRDVKAILCATGGASSVDLLNLIDFDIIRQNPKPLVGYSDVTALLLAIEKNVKGIAIHGPNAFELSYINSQAFEYFINLLCLKDAGNGIPQNVTVLKGGNAQGEAIGGNITLINALLASKFLPEFKDKILFWEEVGESPAMLSFKLRELELSGRIKDLGGMVIGYLSDCVDKKYPKDNRNISDIVCEIFADYDFPIVKWNHFGHDIESFYPISFGSKCTIDTKEKKLSF